MAHFTTEPQSLRELNVLFNPKFETELLNYELLLNQIWIIVIKGSVPGQTIKSTRHIFLFAKKVIVFAKCNICLILLVSDLV